MNIIDLPFPQNGNRLLSMEHGLNWPVVYLLHNEKEIYVGETTSAYMRYQQHADPNGKYHSERKRLKHIKIIFDDQFNKSAILDIEQSLIRLIEADSAIQKELGYSGHLLQNRNGGQSSQHNYYNRSLYQSRIEDIWKELIKLQLASNTYDAINNSDLFKYSPYISLTTEQEQVCRDIIRHMVSCLMNDISGSSIIRGTAGTGKSIVLINMIMTILTSQYIKYDYHSGEDTDDYLDDRYALYCELDSFFQKWKKKTGRSDLKIGFIVPMDSIRSSFKAVFKLSAKSVKGMKASIVIGPNEVIPKNNDREFDVVFVDEAHRLKRRRAMAGTEMSAFDKCCSNLGLDPQTATHLDFILAKTKYQVFVYDEYQSIKPTDIPSNVFLDKLNGRDLCEKVLRSQMRCDGGGEYTKYIEDIFNCKAEGKKTFRNYDIKLYSDPNKMIEQIIADDKQYGLCRTLAGYSWEWVSSKEKIGKKKDGSPKYKKSNRVFKSIEEIKADNRDYDIVFDGKGYYWNLNPSRWILNSSPQEIGCVHTSQGYDLNRVGIILGREINYDPNNNCIQIDRNLFYDAKVKEGTDDKQLKTYIINAYKVMMMRGIKACYIYACNDTLRKYLSRFFDKA